MNLRAYEAVVNHGLVYEAVDRVVTLYNYDRIIAGVESGRVHEILWNRGPV